MSKVDPSQWDEAVRYDFIHLFCGDYLGGGVAREVYSLAIDPDAVIKVERAPYSFQNIMEWQAWQEVRTTQYADWFAPCHWISPCGRVMIQARTQPLEQAPEKIPDFFTDTVMANWGQYRDRIVCHDYGMNFLIANGLAKADMQDVEFWP